MKNKTKRTRCHGFTLIELMIAVVVVSILAAVAYPSYQDYLRRSHRAAAQTFLVEVANRQQQYLLDARNYAVGSSALTTLNLSVPADVSPYYAISISPSAPATPPEFTVTATPVSGSMQSSDGALTLDHQGQKTRAGQSGW